MIKVRYITPLYTETKVLFFKGGGFYLIVIFLKAMTDEIKLTPFCAAVAYFKKTGSSSGIYQKEA